MQRLFDGLLGRERAGEVELTDDEIVADGGVRERNTRVRTFVAAGLRPWFAIR